MIETLNLRKSFGAVRAVDGVSFSAADGAITGLLGPNGAGKTTTLRMLYTLMAPESGSVRVDGIDAAQDPIGVRRRLGVLPDARGLYKRLTARENIDYFGRLHGLAGAELAQRRETLVELLDMGEFAGAAHRGLLAGTARQDRHRAGAGPRSEERGARRADQRARRDGDAFDARLHAAPARRGPLRAVLEPHHAGGGGALRPHRGDRPRPGGGRRDTADELRAPAGEASLEDAFVKVIGSNEGLVS